MALSVRIFSLIFFVTVGILNAQYSVFPLMQSNEVSRKPIVFYISSSGNNSNSGRDSTEPWQTLSKLGKLYPGDTIRFKGGDTITGTGAFSFPSDAADSRNIVFNSYGSGKAILKATSNTHMNFVAARNIVMRNLKIRGQYNHLTGQGGSNSERIISFGSTTQSVIIDNVEMFAVRGMCIYVGGASSLNFWITNSLFYNSGHVVLYMENSSRRDSIVVRNNVIYNFVGDSAVHFGGSVIGFANGRGCLVERNLIYNCGAYSILGGPATVYSFSWKQAHWRYNEIYGVHSKNGSTDGDAFDLDADTDSSIVEYNYVHNLDGCGVLIGVGSHRNIIRYNIIKNAAIKNNHAGIFIWGANNDVYSNTIVLTTLSASYNPIGIFLQGSTPDSNRIKNNIISANDSLAYFIYKGGTGTLNVIQGNCYYSAASIYKFGWDASTYTSLTAWRTASGQETVGGSNSAVNANPLLNVNFALRDTINNAYSIDTLTNYKLQAGSPCLNVGLNAQSGLWNTAARDFFNNVVPNGNYDMGVFEKP